MPGSMAQAIAELFERGYSGDHKWHGELLAHVKDLTAEQALWRPADHRKCIWENVRHLTFWRRALLNRVKGLPTPDEGDNGWSLPKKVDDVRWRAELDSLKAIQDELQSWFDSRQPEDLLQKSEEGRYDQFASRVGIIAHDSYHTGQIAYIRSLMGLPPVL